MPKSCPDKCGNVTIPFPFGIGKNCYLDETFGVECNESSNSTFLSSFYDQVKISEISLLGYVTVNGVAFPTCYNKSGDGSLTNYFVGFDSVSLRFSVSLQRNKFVAIGCDIYAYIPGDDYMPTSTGCASFCDDQNKPNATSAGCMIGRLVISLVVKQAKVKTIYASGTPSAETNETGGGYNCYCQQGYQGNPYLPDGCQDIDECKDLKNNKCKYNSICINTPGSYKCICPTGHYNSYIAEDGLMRCIPGEGHPFSPRNLLLGVGIATVVLILIALGFWLYRHFERRKKIRIKQKFFKRNGGLLFKHQISSSEGSVMKTKLFAAEELKKATDNFNQSRVLGKGGLGTVYKGMLQDGSIVAVKRSNMINENQVGQFINEVSILLQIDHRNIVKLLGCCLETEVPLLVYEYVSNGTLSHHLHDKGCVSMISWENRLQIAKEVAGALAYLHSYASTSIIHRDIKSTNILLDENFRAVVSDFGLSRSVSIEKTHLTTAVGGTFGYIDPEYFRSGQLTDKSDVYAFGVVLAELLTGVKAISLDVSELGLVLYFQSSMKQNRLFEILDPQVVTEGVKEDILVVAKLAKRCLKLNAKKRPSMREAAADLDRLTGKQIKPSHELIRHKSYLSQSQCSYSYVPDEISEDCSKPSLFFPNHIA